ncbi:MAG: cob(I)yrinic acid a,c-diamide adenosyltransferase [Syntrophaceae bacterium]|jgi:cob(I)alamin adenosyltransferase|nr:cob(I)yrinic acid a,c-diamide adenosyltransferase [Syntrophaceae bacterium]HOC59212.1 cob(I)yrinic acid a,c-diamide adenosyltransferase [Smithellaceae bacterium]HQM45252.1 cob(I)yrinic acid a,c-diamide adenosyltransferase [Smithellaceae bacterium]
MNPSRKQNDSRKKASSSHKPCLPPASVRRGLVIVITGNGKGKTTSAFGQALRAIGQGYKVFVLQFMKGRDYGEYLAAKKYLPRLTIRRAGLDSFVMRDNPAPEDIELARQGFEQVKAAVASDKYDMIILDEINVAVDFQLIPLDEVVALIQNKPPALDLILTGRYAAKKILKLADTVSEVKEIKHHYAAGIKDRAGIEY